MLTATANKGGSDVTACVFTLLLIPQRKSNKAKEKKARRLEERAAMDAICAKVDAANKVALTGGSGRRHPLLWERLIDPVSG